VLSGAVLSGAVLSGALPDQMQVGGSSGTQAGIRKAPLLLPACRAAARRVAAALA